MNFTIIFSIEIINDTPQREDKRQVESFKMPKDVIESRSSHFALVPTNI